MADMARIIGPAADVRERPAADVGQGRQAFARLSGWRERPALVALSCRDAFPVFGTHGLMKARQMNAMLRTLLLAAGVVMAGQAAAEVTLFTGDDFRGRSFTTDRTVWNLDHSGFNDRVSSIIVRRGAWEVCSDARFEGRCVVLRPGRYPNLAAAGMDNQISSVREITHQGRANRDGYYAYNNPDRRFYDNDSYTYRSDGRRYGRYENRWERY